MKPEDRDRIIEELYADLQRRRLQQIAYPLDEASKLAIGAPYSDGTDNTNLTDSISIGPGGGSADVPKAYAGAIYLVIEGIRRKIPYL